MASNTGTKKIFSSPVLEYLTRTHIAVPLTIFYGLSIVMLAYGVNQTALPVWQLSALFFSGLLLFTLVEYLVHKGVFHMAPTTEWRRKIRYNFHGVHHDFPKDKTRLAMPPLVSVTLAALLFLGTRAIMGDYTFGFLPGFITGYASYLCVHYIVHAFRPPKNIFKVLWVHHGIHHYKDDTVAFGVSSPLWDWVFGTMPKKS
ncbi:MAG: sterol desaturase family protein [Bernardetiaceae bacterium]